MKTKDILVSIIGLDEPGIVAATAETLTRLGCNIEQMTQTTLRDQFTAVYLVNKPEDIENKIIRLEIQTALRCEEISSDGFDPRRGDGRRQGRRRPSPSSSASGATTATTSSPPSPASSRNSASTSRASRPSASRTTRAFRSSRSSSPSRSTPAPCTASWASAPSAWG